MKKILAVVSIFVIGVVANPCQAQENHVSKYAGQETRSIKGLSDDDIDALKRGTGWGLAKVAELNGVPGPRHVLDMKTEISLDEAQIAAITGLYEEMKTKAISQGEIFIALEQELDKHFAEGTITDSILRSSLDAISEARSKLRYGHLAAHLQTVDILSMNQVVTYNKLRGYYGDDLCANIPAGHDADMWRKHNGCEQ